MLKFTSFFFFAVYTLCSVRAQIGAAGQNCTPGDDDSRPSVCTQKGQYIWETSPNLIECKENYDCCLCGSLKCSPNCDAFKANGDYSAYYVPSIIVDGNADDGAEIDCDGDASCRGAVFSATRIKGIKCGGDESCFGTEITAQCMLDNPCKLECDGGDSCAQSKVHLTNVQSVHCADRGCLNSNLILVNPDDDFKLECGAEKACKKATIEIIINGDNVNEIKSIDCGGPKACKYASITITNIGSSKVTLKEFSCEGEKACRMATFRAVGNIEVESCSCEEGACNGATFEGFTCD